MTKLDIALIGTCSGLAGILIGHRLTNDRDSKTRRLRFVQFLGEWLSEIARVTGRDTVATYAAYMQRVHQFVGHTECVMPDICLCRRGKFKRAADEFASLRTEQITNENGDCRDVVTPHIREFIRLSR